MDAFFIKFFNLGVTAGWLVLAIILLRPLMKRAPKWINCLLWGIVGLRLVFPFSLESIFSLIPSAEPLPENIMMTPAPEINSGVGVINNAINPIISTTFTPGIGASVNPMQLVIAIASVVWVIGIALMLGYGIVSYILMRIKVRVSVRGEEKVYFCDEVDSPFILGVFRPRIYVPSEMKGEALDHVLAHERAHLRRGDHLWKPVGFTLLAIYWFNPLLWVAYALLCRDIEAACDEKVIKIMPDEAKKSYSEALLACSLHRKRIMACPLAFGEVGVKERIKSVLNYKKPAFWVIIAALVATVILSVCFLTNPQGKPSDRLTVGSEWTGEGLAIVNFAVEENGAIRGYLNYDSRSYDIVLHTRSAGLVRGSRLWVEIRKGDLIDAMVTEDDLLLSGSMRTRGDKLILVIDKDNLGITQYEKKLVFKQADDLNMIGSNGLVYIPDLSGLDYKFGVRLLDYGIDKAGVGFEFKQAFRSGDDILFAIEWDNKGVEAQAIGPQFEILRYDGGSLTPLPDLMGWDQNLIELLPGTKSCREYNITEQFDISAPGKYRFECHGAWVEFEVVGEDKEETSSQNEANNAAVVFDPSYSAYDSSRKYDVYVWQMAANSFSFGLLDSKPRSWLDDELWDHKGVDASRMRQILLDKNLGPNDVNIVHWQNPLSSYIGDFWVNWHYIDYNTPQENFYYAIVYDMLFGASPRRYYPTATETEWFDIDGDGTKEENRIFFGLVDGKFMFRYIISEDNKTAAYNDIFYTEPMSLKFFTTEDKLRLRGVTEDGGVHIYDIVPEDGHVKLTEIESTFIADSETLDLTKADLSLVNRIVVTNGKTGEVTYLNTAFDRNGFNAVMNALKTVKATDPVSNKGHSGFNYHVELYYDFQTVFAFSLCNEPTGAPRIVCGYYETDGGVDYAARYKLTGESYAKLEEVLKKYFK